MTAAALAPLDTQPLREFRVLCEVEAHDGVHRLWLVVLATDEDDASDQALHMLDSSRVKDVTRSGKAASG